MSNPSHSRTRPDRVSTLRLPPGNWERAWCLLCRGDVLVRLVACFVTTWVLWSVTQGWLPQLGYRPGDIPARDLVVRVRFQVPDTARTSELRRRAEELVEHVYRHDPQPLAELRQELKDKVYQLLDASNDFGQVEQLWSEFMPPDSSARDIEEKRTEFEQFVNLLAEDRGLEEFDGHVATALSDFERVGLLNKLKDREGRKTEIRVYRGNDPAQSTRVSVREVLIPDAAVRAHLRERLREEFSSPDTAEHVFAWLYSHLPETLHFESGPTDMAVEEAKARVPQAFRTYTSDDVIALRGRPLTVEDHALLESEHQAFVATMGTAWRIYFAIARWGMFVALFGVCGAYMYYRGPQRLAEWKDLISLLALVALSMALAKLTASVQAEIIPCLLFGMTMVIVYQQEIALLMAASLSLAVTMCLGEGLPEYVTMLTTIATALLMLRRVRNRTRLINVGLAAGVMAFATTFGVQIVAGCTHLPGLLERACWQGMYAALAGLLMTGLLPFIERWFDVQTDLRLLELGDVAHPLLQELLRRAPGTYNHSINVASLAEAAADAIGANGLLVRVGAYYHDIGKMLKPGYFVENQMGARNRHETLPPTMSTLVIIAHVKDGADLARKNRLPAALIDFIQQHHGTTLVEYFYRQANLLNENDPDAAEVDEGSYRYPGPKPQSREAAVLMLADAAESAARALQEPAPARIENLVEELAMKRLMDGQFDDCGLTLQELRTIQDSLTKSLSAVYHGRVKYPAPQTA